MQKTLKNVCMFQMLMYICVIKQTNNNNTMKATMTIRQIRTILFDTDKYAVIGTEEMTNKQSRNFLYALDNQDESLHVIDNGSHLLIW